ncbi:hypothetical protein [Streptomyces sp. NPDC089915]|uniref:hypothetical protein n=1 Tax=Streptomyces sp. NPDC089915 TaxID=3155186 RepID=UPI00342CBB04
MEEDGRGAEEGLGAPAVDHAASAVVPYARAKLNPRFHPHRDPVGARTRLVGHLRAQRPSGIPLTVTPGDTGPGFEARTGGPAHRAAPAALKEACVREYAADFRAAGAPR